MQYDFVPPMGVSPGTGAGIGIAVGLLVLFLVGPVAYKHNKKRRASAQLQQTPTDSHLEAGQKAQLEDTAVSPNTWRNSNYASSTLSGPEVVSQNTSAGSGIQRRPISEAAGSEVAEADGAMIPAKTDAGDETARAELAVGGQSPYGGRRAELRADALTPPESLGQPPQHLSQLGAATTSAASHSRPVTAGNAARTTSDSSLEQMPVLPGPLLPPRVDR